MAYEWVFLHVCIRKNRLTTQAELFCHHLEDLLSLTFPILREMRPSK